MDDFFDEIDKVIGRKPKDEPKCGMDKLVRRWLMKRLSTGNES